MWRCERRCEDEKVWEKVCRRADVKRRRWESVKMGRCEDEQMWRWEGLREDVKMRRCEDEKVKMRRWDTDPHYWKNPALRRSREQNPRQGGHTIHLQGETRRGTMGNKGKPDLWEGGHTIQHHSRHLKKALRTANSSILLGKQTGRQGETRKNKRKQEGRQRETREDKTLGRRTHHPTPKRTP